MRCSRKARWLIPLSSIGEVAHFAIRANLHIDALTMLKDAWQSIVGRCAVFLFRVFRLLLQTYDIILNDMLPRVCFPQAPQSKKLSIVADLFLQSQHLSTNGILIKTIWPPSSPYLSTFETNPRKISGCLTLFVHSFSYKGFLQVHVSHSSHIVCLWS